MIKLINCIRRKPRFDRDAFQEHWLEYHAPFAPSEPTIRSYSQLHARDDALPRDHLPQAGRAGGRGFDGCAVVTWDSPGDMKQSFSDSPVMEAGIADDRVYIALEESVACVTREEVLLEPRTCFPGMDVSVLEPPSYVLVECLRRDPSLDREEFQERWREHGERMLAFRDEKRDYGLMGYIQNYSLPGGEGGVEEFSGEDPFDGIGMAFFGSVIFFREFVDHSLGAPSLVERERTFVDHSRSRYMLARRHRLRDPVR